MSDFVQLPDQKESVDEPSPDRMDEENFQEMLQGIERDADKSMRGHYIMARRWRLHERWITLPLAVATAITAGGVTATLSELNSNPTSAGVDWTLPSTVLRMVFIASAFLSPLLAALNTHLQPARIAESHENSGKRYSLLRARARYFMRLKRMNANRNAELARALLYEQQQIREGGLSIDQWAYVKVLRQLKEKSEQKEVKDNSIKAV